MAKYKLWLEIERTDDDDSDPVDLQLPFGIAYADSLEEILELREDINATFGEINDDAAVGEAEIKELLIEEIFNLKYKDDDPKYDGKNLEYLRSLSLEELKKMLNN